MKAELNGSYPFDSFKNQAEESVRLRKRAGMRMDQFIPLLKRHGLTNGMDVLEIGCGHGIRSYEMATHFPQTKVSGLDVSSSLLNEAKEMPLDNLQFVQGNAEALPFADGSQDFVYARLVFMHLKNPLKVMSEVKRILRPGGVFLIEDADRDFMHFYPTPEGWKDFWSSIQAGQRQHGGDPNVGRKLENFFRTLGFIDLQIELLPIHGWTQDVEELCDTLMPALNEYLDENARAPGEKAIRELKDLCRIGEVSMYHLWFVTSGRVL